MKAHRTDIEQEHIMRKETGTIDGGTEVIEGLEDVTSEETI